MRNPFRVFLDFLMGCSHSRTSFPMTPKTGSHSGITYVACLDCGKEFHFSWDTMKHGSKIDPSELQMGQADGAR